MGRGRRPRIAAPFTSTCWRCDERIQDWRDAVKTRSGHWIHRTCAPGADDE